MADPDNNAYRAILTAQLSDTEDISQESAAKAGPTHSPHIGALRQAARAQAWGRLSGAEALRAWCACVAVWLRELLGRSPACARAPAWHARAWETRADEWLHDPWVVAVFADIARAATHPHTARTHVLTLAALGGLLRAWLHPADGRARMCASAPLWFFYHVSGWALVLVLTATQLRGGADRRRAAAGRAIGMPTPHFTALAGPADEAALRAVARWLVFQAEVITHRARPQAAVYVLADEHAAYVGWMGSVPAGAGDRRLGLPAARARKHERDVARRRTGGSAHKVQTFARTPAGMLCIFVAVMGTPTEMRGLERSLLRGLPRAATQP